MDGDGLKDGRGKQKAGEKQGAAIAPQRKRHSSSVPLGTRFEAQGTGLLTCAKVDYLPGAAAPVVAAIQTFCRHPQKERRAGALTVAGQWRTFTAFPSIPLQYR